MQETKVCTKCGEEKPATNEHFSKSKKGDKLGLRATCKECQRKESKEYYERIKPLPKEINFDNKICRVCGVKYPLGDEYFYKRKESKDGYRNDCIKCCNKRSIQLSEINKDAKTAYNHKYYSENNQRILQQKSEYYVLNKDTIRVKVKAYIKNNADKVTKCRRNHYQKNAEVIKNKRKEYYEANRDIVLEKDKVYKAKFRDRYNKNKKAWKAKKYATDIQFNLNEKISSGIRISLHNRKCGRRWEELVGYTITELIVHIESLFISGMNWEKVLNGEIHIDHKRPKASFNFTNSDDEDFKKCWSLDNLQPLWAEDNLKKRDKW